MKQLLSSFEKNKVPLLMSLLILIVPLACYLWIHDLNYNSPFNDEAIYIVVGKVELFKWDWWSYNASAWMAGLPYLYPPMTAIAYTLAGIWGSRALNVFFATALVVIMFFTAKNITTGSEAKKTIAGLIAAVVIGGSGVVYYVARLATYDMPSFFFLFLSIFILLKTAGDQKRAGMWYFLSALTLLLAIFIKMIVGIYLPLLLVFSYLRSKKLGDADLYYWKRYYAGVIVLTLALYVLSNIRSLLTYATGQVGRDKLPFSLIFQVITDNTLWNWAIAGIGAAGFLLQKEYKKMIVLLVGALGIITFHIVTMRYWTLDKHLFLTVGFLALFAGVGIANLISRLKQHIRYMGIALVCILLITYWVQSWHYAQKFNHQWENADSVLQYTQQHTKKGSKVLAEDGQSVILATYDSDNPFNITTFDWFSYKGLQGDKAYAKAVRDGYFDMIELQRGFMIKDSIHKNVSDIVSDNMNGIYETVFHDKGFIVYQREP